MSRVVKAKRRLKPKVKTKKSKSKLMIMGKGTGMRMWDDVLRELVANKIIPNPLYRILLFGPPRTGKSASRKLRFTTRLLTSKKHFPTSQFNYYKHGKRP